MNLFSEIQSLYRDSLNLYFIISQKNVSFEEISNFIMKNKLEKWSILFDKSDIFAQTNHVEVLPTVFLVNHKNEIQYSGALFKENSTDLISSDNYLLRSIEQFLRHEKVKKKYHQAVGCSFK